MYKRMDRTKGIKEVCECLEILGKNDKLLDLLKDFIKSTDK